MNTHEDLGGTPMTDTHHHGDAAASAPVRPPRVGGVGGGVGTSLIARLLGGDDDGVLDAGVISPGTAVDLLVCSSTATSVRKAIAVAAAAPCPVVLVVVADCGDREPATVKQRLRMAEPNLAALVRVPWFPTLRTLDDPAGHLIQVAWGDRAPQRSERTAAGVAAALVAAVSPLLTAPRSPPTAQHLPPTTSRHVS